MRVWRGFSKWEESLQDESAESNRAQVFWRVLFAHQMLEKQGSIHPGWHITAAWWQGNNVLSEQGLLWIKVITTDVLEEQTLTQDLKEPWSASENMEEKFPGKFRTRQRLVDPEVSSSALRPTCGHSVTPNHNNSSSSSSSSNTACLYLLNTTCRHWSEI